MPWSKLVKSCPQLRTVHATIVTYEQVPGMAKWMRVLTSGEEYARSIVRGMMNQGIDETQELEKLQLSNLASILEKAGRNDYSVTGISHKIGVPGFGGKYQVDRRIYECVSHPLSWGDFQGSERLN